MSDFDFWTWFTLAALGGFAIWETAAIVTGHRERTYTYKIRTWLGLEQKAPWRKWATGAFVILWTVFSVWFLFHIAFGWWGGAP